MNTMLRKRYFKRNANALWQNFLRKDYKKSFLESKSLRFALLLVVRKVITSLTLSDSYRAKVIKSYAHAQYRKRMPQTSVAIARRWQNARLAMKSYTTSR